MATFTHTLDTFKSEGTGSNKLLLDTVGDLTPGNNQFLNLKLIPPSAIDLSNSSKLTMDLFIDVICEYEAPEPDSLSNNEDVIVSLEDSIGGISTLQQNIATPSAAFQATDWLLASFTGTANLSDIVEVIISLSVSCPFQFFPFEGMLSRFNVDNFQAVE